MTCKLQRQIGNGSWDDVEDSEQGFAFYSGAGVNPTMNYTVVDEPNTTEKVSYRFLWKRDAGGGDSVPAKWNLERQGIYVEEKFQ